MKRLLQLLSGVFTVLALAVPVAFFIESSGMISHAADIVSTVPWHPTPPPVVFANQSNYGWATTYVKPSANELKLLYLVGVLTPPVSALPPLPATLMTMPTTGWTLDDGTLITTDSNGVLVLRPLTYGRPSLPGQGQGWRAAYYYPERTARWRNYTLGVTVTNLGGQGSGANATMVVGYSDTAGGYAVTVSAARYAIQDRAGARIGTGVIPARTSHRVTVTLTKRLGISVDGVSIASFQIGNTAGGIGVGVWKMATTSNLPFFRSLSVGPA
jgi:hypothetical protein